MRRHWKRRHQRPVKLCRSKPAGQTLSGGDSHGRGRRNLRGRGPRGIGGSCGKTSPWRTSYTEGLQKKPGAGAAWCGRGCHGPLAASAASVPAPRARQSERETAPPPPEKAPPGSRRGGGRRRGGARGGFRGEARGDWCCVKRDGFTRWRPRRVGWRAPWRLRPRRPPAAPATAVSLRKKEGLARPSHLACPARGRLGRGGSRALVYGAHNKVRISGLEGKGRRGVDTRGRGIQERTARAQGSRRRRADGTSPATAPAPARARAGSAPACKAPSYGGAQRATTDEDTKNLPLLK